MQYQRDIIFALLLFCSKFSYKTRIYDILLHFMLKSAISNLKKNTFYVFNSYDVIFHATSDTNDVITVDVTQLHHFKTCYRVKILMMLFKITFLSLRKSAISSKCADIV